VRSAVDALVTGAAELCGTLGRAAFLDLTAPDLDAVAGELAAAGHAGAVVVPLLFTDAFHAGVDVPATVRAAAQTSGVQLRTADILGTGDDVLGVLSSAARAAGMADDAPVLLYAVGSSRTAANDAVRELADRLAAGRSGPVRAGFGTTDPRGAEIAEELAIAGPVGILPLFVSPGLLLDPMIHLARDRGWPTAPPLGTRLAGLIAARYSAQL
jgi:sirohydrochlorin ferrochelatase